MRNIKINEAETIFEVFWEGHTPKYKWYAVLDSYRQDVHDIAQVSCSNWSAQIKILPGQPAGHLPVSLERDCDLDITGYDTMKIFAGIDKDMRFKMICQIDGVDTQVFEFDGQGSRCEYVGELSGNRITKIRMEFQDISGKGVIAQIVWLGLSNREKEQIMLSEKTPYTPEWDGYFSEDKVVAPQLNMFFNQLELDQLREKVKLPGFSQWMDELRRLAREDMNLVPENEVGKLVIRTDRRFVRDRDMERPVLYEAMERVAFVGIVDENMEMLTMACRIAMAICHCEHFFESIMGVYPGVTWHHLCFTEAAICLNLVKVLDWAGGLLSRRGQNLIRTSILTKGLPIIDKVIKTDEDVWICNQGLVFENSLITIMAALVKQWPRYITRLEEAEKDFFQMWQNYVFQDGGSGEGPAYWNYTMNNTIDALYMLARIHNKPLEDYIPELVKKSGIFANILQSEVGDTYLPLNDSHPGRQFSLKIVQFLARIGAGERWKIKSNEMLAYAKGDIASLIQAQYFDVEGQPEYPEYQHMPVTGITKIRRETEDLGVVALYALSGAAIWGHAHADKGSFVLEADDTALLIDRGCTDYYDTYHQIIVNAEVHNVLAAVSDGVILNQGKAGAKFSGVVLKAEYENGTLDYSTDVTAPWNGAFHKNIRNITSDSAYRYVIRDQAELASGDGVCFILNSYGQIRQEGDTFVISDSGKEVAVRTQNWKPDRTDFGRCGQDGEGRPVNRLCMYSTGRKQYDLTTEICLFRTE